MKNKNKFQINRKLHAASLVVLCIMMCAIYNSSFAQCKPMIKIDGKATVVDVNDQFGLPLPYWLKATQTLACGSSVNSISVIEFDVDINTKELSFSQVIDVNSTTPVAIPANKVWKIESIAKLNNPSTYTSTTFSVAGTYTWFVPACAELICIEMWGGGGGGGYGSVYNSANWRTGGGGAGGGFGSQCFTVTPGATYTVVVGAGGGSDVIGGTSSVTGTGISMSATGGAPGIAASYPNSGTPGTPGGSSTATSNANGADGNGTAGGAGGNGGAGGLPQTGGYTSPGNPGTAPGGGGGGGNSAGGAGGSGRIIISW